MNSQTETETPSSNEKLVWETPELTRIRAGDAEFGATPLVPEGPIGTGS